jgi:hypothetical protein
VGQIALLSSPRSQWNVNVVACDGVASAANVKSGETDPQSGSGDQRWSALARASLYEIGRGDGPPTGEVRHRQLANELLQDGVGLLLVSESVVRDGVTKGLTGYTLTTSEER